MGQIWVQICTIPTFKSVYPTLTYGAVSSGILRTLLLFIVCNFNQNMYKSILEAHVLPFNKSPDCDNVLFSLQTDICGHLRAKSIASYLHSKNLESMGWLAQSPDLNPIESLCGVLNSKLRAKREYDSNSAALFLCSTKRGRHFRILLC